MIYSLVGFSSLLICLIINKDIIFSKNKLAKSYKYYRMFLFMIISYFFTDAMWGVLDEFHLMTLLYIDTVFFFIAMSISVVFWAIFVAAYVDKSKKMNIALMIGGLIIFTYLIVVTIINIFNPILFDFNGQEYITLFGRLILLIFQIILFTVVSIVCLFFFYTDKKNQNRYRYLAIGLFGLFMALSIIGQLLFPLLPIYSCGSILSICLIHIYVVGSEKDEVLKALKASIKREQITGRELDFTKALVYIDSLTGARSKHAFVDIESKYDDLIAKKDIDEFSIVVFDINGLKFINDTKGHESGDIYIKDSYKIIKDVYKNSEVYRFGGDEFVAILDGYDFENREELLNEFNEIIDENMKSDMPVLSIGMADYNKLEDNTFSAVFIKADENMYVRKKYLKSLGVTTR